ncbi:RNA polymerase II elongation factor ELL [Amyelois transitella]|uniref:RNA polymerase II elongation factor ELL n=1 Tax=Amyelois transitella TaxID=680683 RepID=UPI002990503B|nr:RNA polymerase II elongation factor ELL [Amyelois transitella]
MAALPAGVQYGLSSESTNKENKELVFVKLTDSALKAIEDFIKNNKSKLGKPTIQFLPGNEGKISIPSSNGNGPSGETTFHFSVLSNAEMEGPQGSFECVKTGGPRRLETCGPLPRRMRVLANDDSYEATKDRMAKTVAAEQSKCTRVIKPNQTDIGRRVKVRSSLYSGPNAAHIAERSDRTERLDRSERLERPERSERIDRERIDRLERPERAERPAAAPPAARPQQQLPQLQPQQQQLQSQQSQQRAPSNPDLTKRSIKERVIQLLALKPYKKPELYARLNSEGIKERERGLVSKILPQISTLKDNCYHLRRHIWNDVNEDWPFYTEEEKRTLKRRKPQNLTPPLSSDSANSLSPRASPSANKRPSSAAADELPAKKQRISHYRRPSPPSSGYATTSSGERHASDNEDDRSTVKKDNGYTLNFTTVKEICPSPVKANGFRNSPPVEQNNITVKDITNTEEPLDNTELTSAPDEKAIDMADIERQYPPVTSSQTRRAYKNEFTSLYKEYRSLYERVAAVAALFTRLEQQLRRAQPHSPDHHSIEQRIHEEYRRINNDTLYQHERRRVEYLTRKLAHIKQMVQQYDDLRTLKPEHTSATTQAY